MRTKLPTISLWLALALVAWFAVAVFGPKFGVIDWQTGLLTMVMQLGIVLVGIVALVALIALIAALLRAPRDGWWKAGVALAIPMAILAGLMSVRAQGEAVPPIHDASTDTDNPPQFSERVMVMRNETDANPVNDYSTPLGELEMWSERLAGTPLASRSHAEIVADSFSDLEPIPLGETGRAEASLAVKAAMEDIGLTDIVVAGDGTRVEGVAETFAFGFKDDVVARIGDDHIDLRSVSRVGVSDLGYNAQRIRDLTRAIQGRLAS